jgi:DNA-binding NarL/FixJ family response regulator
MRVLIADDHRLIVEGVKRALEEAPDFEVVGECNSGSQVLPLVGRTNPDIVLLDLRMPGADGLACLSRIRKQHPEVKVVVLSVSTDENVIQTVLKRGASAFIVKSINPIDLPSALRQAVDGTVYSAIGLPDPGESAARAAGLTERETAILAALARGLSN